MKSTQKSAQSVCIELLPNMKELKVLLINQTKYNISIGAEFKNDVWHLYLKEPTS